MRMAKIPGRGAPGPEAVPIPAVEEVLLLEDRLEPQAAVEEAPQEHLPEAALLRAAVLQEEPRLALQDAAREAEHRHLPERTVIIMKQEELLRADAEAEEAEKDRIL